MSVMRKMSEENRKSSSIWGRQYQWQTTVSCEVASNVCTERVFI